MTSLRCWILAWPGSELIKNAGVASTDMVCGFTTLETWECPDQLERHQTIHLCKQADCQGGEGLHCTAYDAVDSEALVDLAPMAGSLLGGSGS